MKTIYLKISVVLTIVAFIVGSFSSCSKKDPTPLVPDPTPTLTFAAGPYTCALDGGGSCAWIATSSVPNGGAISYSSSAENIATVSATGVIIPLAAGTTTVTATQAASSGKNSQASASYTLTITGLSITSFTPAIGGVGYSVTITGTNFDATPANNVVTICGVQTVVPTSVSSTSLTVLVPKGASGPGDITVKVGSHTANKGTFTEYATVTTLAGDGTQGYKDATGVTAQFWYPVGLAFDLSGNLLVADADNNRIRSVNTATGVVSTIAGDGEADILDGQGVLAEFDSPWAIAVDATSGLLYVTDKGDDHIRTIDTKGNVLTLAGSDEGDSDGTNLSDVEFDQPQGIVLDAFKNLWITDRGYSLIREVVSPSTLGHVITLAGNGQSNYSNGAGKNAGFYFPDGVVIAPDGNSLYIADYTNNAIRNVTINGAIVSSTFAGSSPTDNGDSGSADGNGTTARFSGPSNMAFDANGNLYVTDTGNGTIRKITAAGVVTTICGSPNGSDSNQYKDGLGPNAVIYQPAGIAIASDGTIYVTDGTNRIRKIVP